MARDLGSLRGLIALLALLGVTLGAPRLPGEGDVLGQDCEAARALDDGVLPTLGILPPAPSGPLIQPCPATVSRLALPRPVVVATLRLAGARGPRAPCV